MKAREKNIGNKATVRGAVMEKKSSAKEKERPLAITVYFIISILGVLGSVLSFSNLNGAEINVLGAWLSGGLLLAYMLFWFVLDLTIIYGIWKRKEWVPNLAIAVIATQILLSLGSLLFIEDNINAALMKAGSISADQAASALSFGRTIAYVIVAITAILDAWFLLAFHNNKDYFTEKGYA